MRVSGAVDGRRLCEAELLYLYLRVDNPELEAARNSFLETITRSTRFID